MGDTLLKQEFREKDVQRMRNIISKKYGDKTVSQIGFTKKEEDHKEGDIWEENEKTWTIKNGIKQTVTKLDSIKNEYRIPLLCPECHSRMQGRVDKKMYSIHGKCSTCVAKMETKLRLEGKYQDYVKQFIYKNVGTYLDDAEQFIMEFAQSSAAKFVTEDGDIEETAGDVDKVKILNKWREEIEEMRQKINTELNETQTNHN